MNLNHLAAIYRLGRKLEVVDGPPTDIRRKVLNDFVTQYPERIVTALKEIADELNDDDALELISGLDKDNKLMITHLYVNIVCAEDHLTEKGRDMVTEIVLKCNLPIPGAEDQYEESVDSRHADGNASATDESIIIPAFILIRTSGLVSRRDSESEDWRSLNAQIAEWIGANRVEVVRFTPPLNEITANLGLKDRHVVFLVDANGHASGKDDNMTGTLLYGKGYEIIGNILIALETNEGYKLEGFRTNGLLNATLNAIHDKVGDIIHTH